MTIRPLREMTGDAVFNEIFLDDAVVDDADLIGGEGNGWAVTQTTLHFERTGIGAGGSHAGFPEPGRRGGMRGRRAGDAAQDEPPDAKLTLGYHDVVELAQKLGRDGDPLIRQQLARLYAFSETGLWNAQRGKAEAKRGGGQSVASIGKLSQTRIVKLAAGLATEIAGPQGMLWGEGAVADGVVSKAMVFSAASSIYGGTDEIQHNIIAERTLGLPREPAPDRDRPFGEVLRDRAPALIVRRRTPLPAPRRQGYGATTRREGGPAMSTASFEVMPGAAPDVMRDYDLATLGYEETEYAVSGTAQSYELKGERGADGKWDVGPGAEAPFRTRIVVRRPIDPARFSGTVVVEWHNVSAGIDAAPDWGFFHRHLTAAGPRLGRRLGPEGGHRRGRVRPEHPPEAVGPRALRRSSSTRATPGPSTCSPRWPSSCASRPTRTRSAG